MAPTLTVSTAGSGNGCVALSGNTSGTSTVCASAVAGTVTNPIVLSNALQVFTSGTVTPFLFFTGDAGSGLGHPANGNFSMFGNTIETARVGAFGSVQSINLGNASVLGGSTGPSAVPDVGLSRSAAAVWAMGNGTGGDTTGKLKAAGYMSVGTTFTSNAGCGDTTLTGGATAGKYTSVTAGTCTTVITMGNSATAPNGWSCTATDLTTIADVGNIHQSGTSATTASLNETTVAANDVIQFSCVGY